MNQVYCELVHNGLLNIDVYLVLWPKNKCIDIILRPYHPAPCQIKLVFQNTNTTQAFIDKQTPQKSWALFFFFLFFPYEIFFFFLVISWALSCHHAWAPVSLCMKTAVNLLGCTLLATKQSYTQREGSQVSDAMALWYSVCGSGVPGQSAAKKSSFHLLIQVVVMTSVAVLLLLTPSLCQNPISSLPPIPTVRYYPPGPGSQPWEPLTQSNKQH